MSDPPVPISDVERDRVRELHAQGLSRAEIARRMGRGATTIGRVADSLGLVFDHRRTMAATRAAQVDAAHRRAELAAGLLEDAFRLRQQLFSPCVVYDFTRDGLFVRGTLDRPPMTDQRAGMSAIGVAVDRHLALIRADADDTGAAAVDAWLRDILGDAVGRAAT